MREIIIALAVLLMVYVTYKFYEVYAITEKYHKLVEELIRKNHENDPDWEDDF
jgi:hypothetical protein